jgi:uncharacterized protein (DUF1684 family)
MKLPVLFLIVAVVAACQSPADPSAPAVSYEMSVLSTRQAKDSSFQQPGSPLPGTEAIARFNGLSYYPVDTTFRVEAEVVKTPDSLPFVMPTTKDHDNQYRQYAWVRFTLQGESCLLGVFEPYPTSEGATLFLPFRDATSGIDTYGGGRYLDLEFPSGNRMTIDFNMAYNPYCVYNYAYSCPIPPAGNTLPVAVTAGEKMIEIPQP